MADPKKAGKISGMNPLAILTGDELMEVSSRQIDGTWKTFSILVNKIRTNAGLSAYEVAVVNGFEGTQTEWLETLKGQSAYQTAVDLGFKGTEEEFIASLVGPSAYNVAVEQGYVGDEKMWLNSLKGQSAYQIALANGYVGTQVEWLASINGKSAYQIAKELDGSVGTEAEWLNSLIGPSAYASAVKLGFVGTEAEWLESLKGKSAYQIWVASGGVGDEVAFFESLKGPQGEQGEDGPAGLTAYDSALLGGYEGTKEEFYEQLAKGSKGGGGGAVFVLDVTPQNSADNVGTKVYTEGDTTLQTCTATTRDVIVKILAMTGFSRFKPLVTVNGTNTALTERGNTALFEGSVAITIPSDGVISAIHNDGPTWTTKVTMDGAPSVLTARFTSAYPSGQTELKAGDKMSVSFTTDGPIVAYEIENSGAFVAAAANVPTGSGTTISNLTIADRGNTTQALGFRIRVKKLTGAWSDWFSSTQAGSVDLVNTVKLNNVKPVITFTSVNYPLNQQALKAAEAATVNHTVTSFDSISYTSTELTVTAPTVYSATKVVNRASGSYNVSTNNLTVTANRSANGTTATASTLVAIANVAPTIAVTLPAARLVSGGNLGTAPQNHVITITANQALIEAPTMVAPAGNWAGAAFVPNAARTVWTRALVVHDDDVKGTYTWGSPSAKSLSGQVTTTLTSGGTYVLGGFVMREFWVAGWPNREGAIGTHVSDTAKLRCTNQSKGQSGTLNATYEAAIASNVGRYTITGPTKVFNPKGDLWYNNDTPNAVSNTSGAMAIELEELA